MQLILLCKSMGVQSASKNSTDKSAFVHCAVAVAIASRAGRSVDPMSNITAEALSKSPTVGIDVAEMQYTTTKFVFTEVRPAAASCRMCFLSSLLRLVAVWRLSGSDTLRIVTA